LAAMTLLLASDFLLGGALGFQDDGLEFFEDRELLICVVDLGVALLLGDEETDLLEALQFALDVTGVFLDELGQATDVRLEIGILGVDHDDLTTNS
jgi:hypothetical protein